ncbi:MAG: DUF4139 domain-containing protein [Bacteroidia bacterium]|nr:DUF4139 domain-containing protein [Bacteroidia bacterium]
MKTLLITAIVMLAFYISPAQIQPKEVKSEIKEAKIFLLGAEITRKGKINLLEGSTKLLFSHLSTKIDKESIQANFGDGVKITNVEAELKTINLKSKDSLRIAKLQDSIIWYNKNNRQINSKLTTIEGEVDVINVNKILKNNTGGTTVAEIEKLSDFYRKRVSELNQKIYELNEQITDNNKRIKIVTDTITSLSIVRKDTWFEIAVTVQTSKPVTGDFTLSYLVGGTGWSPTYDIRVKEITGQIDMEYKAKVLNQTGEDWENVKISFSSAMPTESQEAPSLEPWRLNFNNRTDYEGRLNEFRPNTINKIEAQKRSGNLALPEGVEFAEVELSPIAFEFKIDESTSIPASGKPYMISITNYKLPVSYKYVAIPKVDPAAFLVAEVTGWEDMNLIEGPTNIYFRGTFMGHSYIKPQLANDTLNISLGRDNRVMINRVKVEDSKGDKLIGTNNREEFTYKISVRNTNPGNIKFTLIDQVPVAQDDDIKVELLDLSGAEKDEFNGRLKWKFDLATKEAKEFTVKFAVKYPKNKQVKIRSDNRIAKYRSARFL